MSFYRPFLGEFGAGIDDNIVDPLCRGDVVGRDAVRGRRAQGDDQAVDLLVQLATLRTQIEYATQVFVQSVRWSLEHSREGTGIPRPVRQLIETLSHLVVTQPHGRVATPSRGSPPLMLYRHTATVPHSPDV